MISRLFGILLLVASVAAVAAWPVQTAVAQEEDEDEDEGDDEGDDDDGGSEEEEEDEDEKDQPLVTAGGLFTMKSYPRRELFRPLTITEKIAQARLGLGVDVSGFGAAFEYYGLSLDAKYGARDHVMLLAGFDNSYNMKQYAIYAGIETALAYDFIDFRATGRISRQAIPVFNAEMKVDEYDAAKTKVAIDVGFPFRYKATKEIAIIALDTLISFDLNSVGVEGEPGGNVIKPDLNPSIGIATNPIEAVSIVLYAQLQVVDFRTDADAFVIPATARIQFSPNQKVDIGGEFTFINLKPPEPQRFYDNRFLTLYAQFRFGR